ncbi:MAG: hypothetical protein KTU85_03525 [Acidimicrobiia bacterium]|nr:hypothetical protein [Acidimicrobiia bacterium]MCY4456459.1 hypothetical protein [Acidimicrobiaceae bacterium]
MWKLLLWMGDRPITGAHGSINTDVCDHCSVLVGASTGFSGRIGDRWMASELCGL